MPNELNTQAKMWRHAWFLEKGDEKKLKGSRNYFLFSLFIKPARRDV